MSTYPTPDASFDQPAQPSKGMSITALVLSILGCIPLAGIVGIILGVVALRRAKAEPSRFGGEGLAMAAIIVGIITTILGCTGGGFMLLLPALGQARQTARHVVTMSKLQQCGIAALSYATDNKDYLPPADWKSALSPNYLPLTVFVPDDPTQPGDAFTYVGNLTRLDRIASPSSTILAYENNPHPFRGRIAALFADGSVRDINASDLPSLLSANALPGPADSSPTTPPPRSNP
jgi:hypothetical protein